MTILDHYIRRHLAQGFSIVLLILLTIFSFLDFVEEVDDTALGNYGTFDALIFVLMTMPERALWLVPISALLGGLIGLSLLDHHNELAVMRASGVSSRQIVVSVFKTTAMLLVIVAIFAQFVGPAMGEKAWRARALAIAGDVVLRKDEGANFWFRDGRRFISVGELLYGRIPTDIEIYELAPDGSLAAFTAAATAHRGSTGDWTLHNVVRKEIDGFDIDRRELPTMPWQAFLSPEQGAVIELDAESLSPTDLYRYAEDLKQRGQSAARYELTLWRKINVPFATIAMVMIALPFVLGPYRRGGIGARVMIGSLIGILFYLVDQVLAQLSLLVALNPAIVATIPATVMFIIGWAMMRRVR